MLPDFPWNRLEPAKAKAAQHPDGIINLSVGSPVDPVAPGIQLALAEAASASGYPQTIGTPQLRDSLIRAIDRRFGVQVESVLPVIGTKEAIAWLPTILRSTKVVIPTIAYPTYEVSALLAGAQVQRADDPADFDPDAKLIYINSPSNPTGEVASPERLRAVVEWAREHDAVVASDECYLGLDWSDSAVSVLAVCDGDYSNVIAINSLSKTSNLASYRAGFLAGCPKLIAKITEVRKHAGLMVPGPIQAAFAAALDDDAQEAAQKLRYASRRAKLMRAFNDAGFEIHHSQAGLYLWMTRNEDCWETVNWLAERGILVAPGEFYGEQQFVRAALTETDEAIAAVAGRL
ncbi:succinyldiaminopimelate transaminase [Corynebacterium sp. 153RC1]|uniref:succinyldiaminopimelate transaminase n=1 Tax=unclassified Corynebacterium TaxID=2624378 RepID=UPI00211C155A|nr:MULTISPECIES: succinyldiaminopimelate transaminase [unclassified Corynebacterium]MCQ9370366.1 succinyldiaminopimelate transaminase [Corynebacterium sp. 35RC1]MCQ9351958.1 succinyldiaminopimelate transaminase [Corynebacterium sp. 209RC1]MCQ9353707.1 succinyldiaminopimelate transaminase [Corynebacterium sp. 1222RC1]MCQ9356309.1 succinyldiaminopimelate transaminase [Corynebacterium sp. 122RC1]MCQ9358411.1 succinyldiaminopimelate transaminase [Corynebacterium sp. 142RC1]